MGHVIWKEKNITYFSEEDPGLVHAETHIHISPTEVVYIYKHLGCSSLHGDSWMSPSCQTAPSFWPPKHTCSLPPKLTCLRVCWGPSVKSFHVCGLYGHRPSPKLLQFRCGLDLTCICWNEKEGTWGVNTWRLQSRGCWEQRVGAGTCKVLLFAFATQRLPPLQIFCQPRLYWSPILGQWK